MVQVLSIPLGPALDHMVQVLSIPLGPTLDHIQVCSPVDHLYPSSVCHPLTVLSAPPQWPPHPRLTPC